MNKTNSKDYANKLPLNDTKWGSSLVFIWSFTKRPNTKNHANAMPTYWMGIGAKPGIPIIESIEEMVMSARIAAKRGVLGFDFQKLPLSRTVNIVNNPPNNSMSKAKV